MGTLANSQDPDEMPHFGYLFMSLSRNHQTNTLANSEVPDEMPHNAAFHQDLHCLLTQN